MTDQTFTFRSVEEDGTIYELELTAGQALDLGAGKAISYWPHDERVLVEEDGTIVRRESAVPLPRAA